MRLLNTRDLKLHEFMGDFDEPYAILSHTWGSEECTLQHMLTPAVAESRAGFRKIKDCCKLARQNGFEWAWVDTCCIDKTSTAELSEAINSMFRWYQKARVCYAYLADVHGTSEHDFENSRWFRRGWTLQELIAPKLVQFYSQDWTPLGSRSDRIERLQAITGIDEYVLSTCDCNRSSIAQRMTWSLGRNTTRSEDQAYSLMGVFDVNMPLLYGEGGTKAFLRLQQEILRVSDDQTIFAWGLSDTLDSPMHTSGSTSPCSSEAAWRGLLADSPARFSRNHKIVQPQSSGSIFPLPSPVVSGSGIRIDLPILVKDHVEYGILTATVTSHKTAYLGLHLIPYETTYYARCGDVVVIHDDDWKDAKMKTVFVREPQKITLPPPNSFRFISIDGLLQGIYLLDAVHSLPHAIFSPSEQSVSIPAGRKGVHAALFFNCSPRFDEICAGSDNRNQDCRDLVWQFAMVIGSDTKHWVTVVPILPGYVLDRVSPFEHLQRIDPALIKCCMTQEQLIQKLNTDDVDCFRRQGDDHQDMSLALPWRQANMNETQFGVLRMTINLETAPINHVDRAVFVCVQFHTTFKGLHEDQYRLFKNVASSFNLKYAKELPLFHDPRVKPTVFKPPCPQWSRGSSLKKFAITAQAKARWT